MNVLSNGPGTAAERSGICSISGYMCSVTAVASRSKSDFVAIMSQILLHCQLTCWNCHTWVILQYLHDIFKQLSKHYTKHFPDTITYFNLKYNGYITTRFYDFIQSLSPSNSVNISLVHPKITVTQHSAVYKYNNITSPVDVATLKSLFPPTPLIVAAPRKSHSSVGPTLTTLIRCPMAFAGRLLVNFALTMPLLPWARVTFPQITRVLLGLPPGVTVFLRTTWQRHTLAEFGSSSSRKRNKQTDFACK